MKFYSKTIVSSVVCILCIIAMTGLFQQETAAQIATDDFSCGTLSCTGGGTPDWVTGSSWTPSLAAPSCGDAGVTVCSGGLRIETSNSDPSVYAERSVDLTGYTSVTLQFDITEETIGNNEYVKVNINGTEIGSFEDPGTGAQTVDLSTISCMPACGVTTIQFEVQDGGNNDYVTIDNVQLTGVTPSLLLTISPSSIAEGETATGTVTRNTDIGDSSLAVTLTIVEYDGDGVADVTLSTANITIGINDASATFTISAAGVADDSIMEPTETITITASEAGGLTDSDDVTVTDNDYAGPYSGDSIGFPTFFLAASYDWLHNFYDDNEEADGTKTDPDTDNFNKIIMLDSNLFPIYTALQGDTEWPNIVMRNWTSGPGTGSPTSPSVNDYMNRSLAVVPNYINATTKLSIGYGTKDKLTALGMRSHLEWAYVLDPANANFRRYKFVKINDVVVPEWYEGGVSGDITDLDPGGGEADVSDCENCCPNSWYQGDSVDILCGSGGGKDTQCCDDGVNCFSDDTQLLFLTKFPKCGAGACPDGAYPVDPNTGGCNGVPNYPACEKDASAYQKYLGTTGQLDAPYVRFPVFVDKSTASGGVFPMVRFTFTGHTHDGSAGAIFILNRGHVSTCEKLGVLGENPATSFPPGDIDWEITGSSSCTDDCKQKIDVDFTSVPESCMEDYDDEQGLMYVDIIPCHHAGIVIAVPDIPQPKDNAFQVAVGGYSNITGGELDGLTDAELEDLIDKRWANISGYMDIVPPKSYPGYPSYTSSTQRQLGYGYTTNTSFTHARNIRFRNPRDIDTYRDYFDYDNAGPVYIFVADTMNSRIQVFMNATGSAGDVNTSFPIRPVRVKAPTDKGTGETTSFTSNEVAMRLYSTTDTGAQVSLALADGRKRDWRNYTTVSGIGSGAGNRTLDNQSRIPANAGRGEFYYPHGVAVDQDPDTKDVYLFVADTYNHRIQIFRDTTGVTNQPITNKRFDFKYEEGWGTYPLQTTLTVTPPGPFSFRYPKGVDVVRFANNSSYLYVVDSKDYRLMKYLISEGSASDGITAVEAVNAYGYDGSNFSAGLFSQQGRPMTASNTNPGFLNPQDVATGYSGFYIYTSPAGKGTHFLNNYMVYVSDYARNNTSISRDYLNMRVQQFIQVPTFANLSGSWIPWDTETVLFGSWTSNNLPLGQSVYGTSDGFYNSSSIISDPANIVEGSTENVPGKPGYFTDRPVGLAALQWNTQKPVDIRVLGPADSPTTAYVAGSTLPRGTALRIGTSSRYLFKPPENDVNAFLNSSTEWVARTGRWDGLYTGDVHIFCYDKYGQFDNHSALHAAPYRITLSSMGCQANGFAKIVAEDKDFVYSARTGTMFFRLGN